MLRLGRSRRQRSRKQTHFNLKKFEAKASKALKAKAEGKNQAEIQNQLTPEQSEVIKVLNQHKVETKVTFQKCKSISRTHCILLQSKDSARYFELFAFKPIIVNDKTITSADQLVRIHNLDKIQFPCDTCHTPHLYHVIIPVGDSAQIEQNHFNAQVFKPLLSKFPESAHKLRSFLEMMQPQATLPV